MSNFSVLVIEKLQGTLKVHCNTVYLPDTIPSLNPKKKPTAAPPSPADMSQSVALSVQSQADSCRLWLLTLI